MADLGVADWGVAGEISPNLAAVMGVDKRGAGLDRTVLVKPEGPGALEGPAGWEAAAGFLASSLLVTSVVGLKLAPLATAGPWPSAPIMLERSGACKDKIKLNTEKVKYKNLSEKQVKKIFAPTSSCRTFPSPPWY